MSGAAVFLKAEKNICSSDLHLQSEMFSFFSSSALFFVYFHIVRAGLIYFLHFPLSLLTLWAVTSLSQTGMGKENLPFISDGIRGTIWSNLLLCIIFISMIHELLIAVPPWS